MIKRVLLDGAAKGSAATSARRTTKAVAAKKKGPENVPVTAAGIVRRGKSRSNDPTTEVEASGKKAAFLLADMMRDLAEIDEDVDPRTLSRIHKGKTVVPAVIDGRTYRARRLKETYRAICSDLGGAEHATELQRSLARRAAALAVVAEEYETFWLITDGILNPIFLESLLACGRTLANIASKLGMERTARDVNSRRGKDPVTLEDYVRGRAG